MGLESKGWEMRQVVLDEHAGGKFEIAFAVWDLRLKLLEKPGEFRGRPRLSLSALVIVLVGRVLVEFWSSRHLNIPADLAALRLQLRETARRSRAYKSLSISAGVQLKDDVQGIYLQNCI